MGLGLYFAEGEGPKFERPLREEWAIRNLKGRPGSPRPSALCHRCRGRDPQGPGWFRAPDRLFRQPLHPVLLHGRRARAATATPRSKRMMYGRPDLMHHILEVTTQAVIDYLNAQIEAGAQAVMVFDSWGGMLSQAAYLEFSLPYMARIMAGLDPGTGRPRRAAHRLHQGRRPVAGAHRRLRLRRGGPGLDHRHRRRPPPRRRQGGAAGQHGPEHPADHPGSRGAEAESRPGELWRRDRAMSSTWGMAYPSSHHRKT
jgi:hypothetical protein